MCVRASLFANEVEAVLMNSIPLADELMDAYTVCSGRHSRHCSRAWMHETARLCAALRACLPVETLVDRVRFQSQPLDVPDIAAVALTGQRNARVRRLQL
jgi:hypothetical protein